MKTCPHCEALGQSRKVSLAYYCPVCIETSRATLEDLAVHLRDSGEYAVIRMDDPAVVALREADSQVEIRYGENGPSEAVKEVLFRFRFATEAVCRKAGILKCQ